MTWLDWVRPPHQKKVVIKFRYIICNYCGMAWHIAQHISHRVSSNQQDWMWVEWMKSHGFLYSPLTRSSVHSEKNSIPKILQCTLLLFCSLVNVDNEMNQVHNTTSSQTVSFIWSVAYSFYENSYHVIWMNAVHA